METAIGRCERRAGDIRIEPPPPATLPHSAAKTDLPICPTVADLLCCRQIKLEKRELWILGVSHWLNLFPIRNSSLSKTWIRPSASPSAIMPPWTLSPVTQASRIIRVISRPVVASQRRAVLSEEAVTMRAPSEEKAALCNPALVAAQRDDLLAGCRVPEARRAVSGGGDDARPVRGEGRTLHSALVAAQLSMSSLAAVFARDPDAGGRAYCQCR